MTYGLTCCNTQATFTVPAHGPHTTHDEPPGDLNPGGFVVPGDGAEGYGRGAAQPRRRPPTGGGGPDDPSRTGHSTPVPVRNPLMYRHRARMRIRHTATALTAATLLTLTACSSADTKDSSSGNSAAPEARQLDTAPNIAAALNDAGLTASTPKERTDESYITKVGGTSYGLTITDKAGQAAPGETGINMFPNAEALAAWIPLSKSFGGVAVTGDTWAVSLPTKSKEARTDSLRLAPQIAEALDGTVQR